MTAELSIFHHIGLITRDMDATIAAYERLGFAFTPLSLPEIPLTVGGEPEPIGVGNRTAVFAENYLEVLAVTDAARWAQISPEQRGPYDIDRPLARYEGLHVLHFGTDEIDAIADRLDRTGVEHGPIRPFRRPVSSPAGTAMMQARVLGLPPDEYPEALVQVAQHLTPELVLQPRYQHHPNGATHISSVTICSPDPAACAQRYARLTGHELPEGDGDTYLLKLGRGRLVIISERVARDRDLPVPAIPSMVELEVHVTGLGPATRALDANGVSYQETTAGVRVAAADAAGCALTFTVASR